MSLDSNTLMTLVRDGFAEVSIGGEISVFDGNAVVMHTREREGAYPSRSLLKPFQFLAADIPKERWAGIGRYAACLGSTAATPEQIAQLQSWYEDAEWKPLIESLKLFEAMPSDEMARAAMRASATPATKWVNNCFSKHMGILEACRLHRWSMNDYTSTAHPFHKRLLDTLGYLLKEDLSLVPIVTDGCQLPTPVLEMRQLAQLYQILADATADTALGAIQKQMLTFPEWVGGSSSVDTKLMLANPGRVIAKEGADGLLAVAVLPDEKYPRGLGICLKLFGGYQPARAMQAMAPLLETLKLKTAQKPSAGHTATYHYKPFEFSKPTWIDISPLLNTTTRTFPEEVGFKRGVSHDTHKGDGFTLSSIETTLHIGAHADAPNHFEKNDIGIDKVELWKYGGSAQVIRVKLPANGIILPEHIKAEAIRAPRILFRTESADDSSRFSTDFVALSSAVIDYLATFDVCLVGIDTPSVDPSTSKELVAHHATFRHGMAILENLVLTGVAPGFYDLVAFPLKIENGDASPVRAALRQVRGYF